MTALAELQQSLTEQRIEQLRRLRAENAGLRSTIHALNIWQNHENHHHHQHRQKNHARHLAAGA